jgi:hypothetical protein
MDRKKVKKVGIKSRLKRKVGGGGTLHFGGRKKT